MTFELVDETPKTPIKVKAGDKVVSLKTLGDAPSGDSPGGCYCYKGEMLIVRKVSDESCTYPISVSHEDITDRSFGVTQDEVKKLGNIVATGNCCFIEEVDTDSSLKFHLWIHDYHSNPRKHFSIAGAKKDAQEKHNFEISWK